MTKKIDTSELMDEEDLALGRSYIHRSQQSGQIAQLNHDAYKTWYAYLYGLAISRFEWEGLPSEIDTRFVEYTLLHRGMGGFFAMGRGTAQWAFCPATPIGNLNLYFNPNRIQLTPPTGGLPWYRHAYYFIRDKVMYKPNAIICWNDLTRKPFIPTIRYYARRLAHVDRTVDVNMMAQQTPFIIASSEMGRRDANNLTMQVMGHAAVLSVSDRLLDSVSANVLNVNAPYVSDKLLVDAQKILNQYYSMLGIDNTNTEKRERMIDAEATSNNEQIMLIRRGALRCREEFCRGVAELTDGVFTPTVRYAAPYRLDGSVDMSGGM